MKRILLAGIMTTALVGAVLPVERTAATVTVGRDDCGKSLVMTAGERLEVVLAGNPTTGFLWLVSPPLPAILIQEAERPFTRTSSLSGSPGLFTLRFLARDAGEGELKLAYRRPWEELPPVDSCSFSIAVNQKKGQVSARYISPRGERMAVRFDLTAGTATVTLPDGRVVTLPAAPAASGARYSNGAETFWEHQGTGRFFTGDTVRFEGRLSDTGGALPEPAPVSPAGHDASAATTALPGDWYETDYLRRLTETRSPCLAVATSRVPRITVRQEGDDLYADLEYRFHERLTVKLGKAGDDGGIVLVLKDPKKREVEQIVWKGGMKPKLSLVRSPFGKRHGTNKHRIERYRPLPRQELNRLVIAGSYRSTTGTPERTVDITPEGRFTSRPLNFGYDVGLDCTFAACDYLQANDGSRDTSGFPLRYGFSRSDGKLLILPIRYEGDERLTCDTEPLLSLEPVAK